MKKILFLAALALGVMSCAKEQPSPDPKSPENLLQFTATILEASDPSYAKTQIDIETDGNKKIGKVTWVIGDEITITEAGATGTPKTAVYYVSAISSTGRATMSYKSGDIFKGTESGYTADYGDVENQYYDAEHVGSNCPMHGTSTSVPTLTSLPSLEFHNTCAVVRVRVQSSGAILDKVSVSGYDLHLDPPVNISDSTYFDVAINPMLAEESLTINFHSINDILQAKSTKAVQLPANVLHRVNVKSALHFDMDPLDSLFTIDNTGNQVRFSKGSVWTSDQVKTYKFTDEQYFYYTMSGCTSYLQGQIAKQPEPIKGLFTTTEYTTSTASFISVRDAFPGWELLTDGTTGELHYMLEERTTKCRNKDEQVTGFDFFRSLEDGTKDSNGARYALIQVAADTLKGVSKPVGGLLIFPDNFSWPTDVTVPNLINNIKQSTSVLNYWENKITYSVSDFKKIEKAGCVFLPAAGRGNSQAGTGVQNAFYDAAGSYQNVAYGVYMADSNDNQSYFQFLWSGNVYTVDHGVYAKAIRLVLPVRRITKDTQTYIKDVVEEVISE